MREWLKKLSPVWVLKVYQKIRFILITALLGLFRIFPIHPYRVVICNVWGFGDNAKYVTEELAGRKYKKLEIIFITNHPGAAGEAEGVTFYKSNSIKAIYALATARVWVDNNRKESYIRKRKGQYYIQTWHGGIALKKIEKDYEEHLGSRYVRNAKRDSAMTDLYISNSDFCTGMYQKSFWYKGPVLECGSPRNDILIHPKREIGEQVRKALGIGKEIKIALYAPTYREGKNNTSAYSLDYELLLSELKLKFGGEWIVAVRLHPLVSAQSDTLKYNDRVINTTHYRDIYELMSESDVLITDYSNIMFEFSFTGKPVFLYAADMKEYENSRGFYFDYNALPYYKAVTMQELAGGIKAFDKKEYEGLVKNFFEGLVLYENGHASKAVADRIIQVIKGR
ncbi:CDP-glycerol glycerophosphotransferase family protein [Anaerocolumna xylanovorans]|uniref:CDP-glycerol glycerophosphotransferase n=1 Tax=Anaerocolumna xylanovorans DSM 12503 TaxID=1121345 RepID=A0A1M7YHP1_9FIRM|nr:CDP-glycerol glycerophosphotransferase family protein [Anaerocolumna xylanovorans]SHO52150.1 CDP-glycerol glycerophosphotransferase [Anaerocolumna xylanovorans DSM 12503]